MSRSEIDAPVRSLGGKRAGKLRYGHGDFTDRKRQHPRPRGVTISGRLGSRAQDDRLRLVITEVSC